MQVLSQAITQGTVTSASLLNSTAQTYNYLAALQLGSADLSDPNLSIVICPQISLEPGIWRALEPYEWQGGKNRPAQIAFTAFARRVRVQLDLSRPVSVGATISQSV